jgi:cell division protein ZapA
LNLLLLDPCGNPWVEQQSELGAGIFMTHAGGNGGSRTQTQEAVEVTILGQRMRLKADDDPRRIEQLATYIQRKVDEISAGAAVAPTKLAVLAALNIADDYFRALDDNRQFKREVAGRSRALLTELDSIGQNNSND